MIHIHNGDVVAETARREGIEGEHLTFRESLIAGPVEAQPLLETRAHALSEMSGQEVLRVSNDLFEQSQALEKAQAHGEIVLWFEHDLYCLVHFVYLIQRLAGSNLSAVWHPSPLGSVEQGTLIDLFRARAHVTPPMIDVARRVWADYTSADPRALNPWLTRNEPYFPFLREGLTLHASRFPSVTNGLGAVEQRALNLIAAGHTDFVSLFENLNSGTPSLGFGDSEVLRTLRQLASAPEPPITLTELEPPKALLTITDAGMEILAGTRRFEMNTWLGGTQVTSSSGWRFDGTAIVLAGGA